MEFDFSQNASVTDVNKIPADFRGLYKDGGNGTFTLDTEHAGVKSAVSAITGLNNALKASRAEAKARPAAIDLSPLKEYGDEPGAILTKFTETVDGLKSQIKGVNVDKIKTDLAGEWQGKLTKAEEKSARAEKSFHNRVVVGDAKAAIAQHKGDVDLLLPFVLQSAKVISNKDGDLDVVILDDAGDIRYSGVTGKPLSVAERVLEMKGNEKFGKLFTSDAPAGGGAAPGAAGGKPNNAAAAAAAAAAGGATMSPTQKIKAALDKGLVKKGS